MVYNIMSGQTTLVLNICVVDVTRAWIALQTLKYNMFKCNYVYISFIRPLVFTFKAYKPLLRHIGRYNIDEDFSGKEITGQNCLQVVSTKK